MNRITWSLLDPVDAFRECGQTSTIRQEYPDRDTLLEVATGRAPMRAFEQRIKDWRAKGGDAIRHGYEVSLVRQGT